MVAPFAWREVLLAVVAVAASACLAPNERAYIVPRAAALVSLVLLALAWRRRSAAPEPTEQPPPDESSAEVAGGGKSPAGAPVQSHVVSVYGFKVQVSGDGVAPVPVEAAKGEGVFPPPPDDAESVSTQASTEEDEPQLPLTLSFLHVEKRAHEPSGKPELCCTWLEDGELCWEDLEQALENLDRFSRLKEAQQGFAVLYDFRNMGSSTVGALHRLLQYPAEPPRCARWRSLNFSVKFLVVEGQTYALAKASLSSWLAMNPPLTRTILLPEPPDKDGACWDACPSWPPARPQERSVEATALPSVPALEPLAEERLRHRGPVPQPAPPLPRPVKMQLDRYLSFVAADPN